jgi:phosphoglycolate phosphatase
MSRGCLLFDLDGTLVDSLPDLATAINLLRADYDLEPLSIPQVRTFVGDGASALVQRSLPEGSFEQNKLQRFLNYYQQHLCELSTPYPGIPEMLEELQKYQLAVVTNKPQQMAQVLLDKLGLGKYFQLVLGGDSCPQKKPHPGPVLTALKTLKAENRSSLMIGDHHTDLRAAISADTPSCFCSWGYGNDGGEAPTFRTNTVAELRQILINR